MNAVTHVESMSLSSNNLNRFFQKLPALALVAGAIAGCTEAIPPAAVAQIDFRIPQDSVLQTRTYQLQVRMLSATGTEISGRTPKYESLFPTIATVDAKGLVTPVATGSAAIRATIDGRTATAGVKVLDRVARVVLAPATDQIPQAQTRQLTVTVTASNGASIAGRAISFSSSNPGVATVNAAGVVSAVSLGTTTITASADLDQVSGTAAITVVSQPVASVAITPTGTQIVRVGSFLQLNATARDANNNPIAGKTAVWSSNNPAVATVSAAGLITGVSLGQAVITADIDGRTASTGVQVTEVPPRSVTLAPDTLPLPSGSTRQLVPTVVDSLGRVVNSLATRTVLWASSNPAVATVSTSGLLTTLTAGTARINVTVDNVRSNDIVIVVTDQVQSIRLTPFLPQVMRLGGTLQLSAVALNSQNQPIAGKTINWTTSSPSVASVSASGLVTALALGNVSITAESETRTATINISVTPVPLQSVTIGPAVDTLAGGEAKQYALTMTDTAGRTVTSLNGRNVTWTSSNQLIAVVNGSGIAQANSQQNGTTTVSVVVDNVSSNDVSLNVIQIVQLVVSPNPATVRVGQTTTLTVTPKDIAGNTVKTNRSTSFGVANGALATVTPAGVITGVAQGNTIVNAVLVGLQGVITQVPLTVNP